MSTRSATIIRQTEYWGEECATEEVIRFYRHCDGYPEGHGMQMALAIKAVDLESPEPSQWLAELLCQFFKMDGATHIEIEPKGCQHGDLEYLYMVEGTVDRRWGLKKDGTVPATISVYEIGWDEEYKAVMEREPLFSGTAYEYIEKFGKEQ